MSLQASAKWVEDSIATGGNGNQSDNSASGSGAAYIFKGVGVSALDLWRTQHFGSPENNGDGEE
ncbi:MAG: hypothetical protein ACR2OZ_10420 [Verrucomicrobiales bacterium]